MGQGAVGWSLTCRPASVAVQSSDSAVSRQAVAARQRPGRAAIGVCVCRACGGLYGVCCVLSLLLSGAPPPVWAERCAATRWRRSKKKSSN